MTTAAYGRSRDVLLDTLRHELDLSVLVISHDVNLVANHADQMLVMSAGPDRGDR